jgi:hypothetical protein
MKNNTFILSIFFSALILGACSKSSNNAPNSNNTDAAKKEIERVDSNSLNIQLERDIHVCDIELNNQIQQWTAGIDSKWSTISPIITYNDTRKDLLKEMENHWDQITPLYYMLSSLNQNELKEWKNQLDKISQNPDAYEVFGPHKDCINSLIQTLDYEQVYESVNGVINGKKNIESHYKDPNSSKYKAAIKLSYQTYSNSLYGQVKRLKSDWDKHYKEIERLLPEIKNSAQLLEFILPKEYSHPGVNLNKNGLQKIETTLEYLNGLEVSDRTLVLDNNIKHLQNLTQVLWL